MEFDYADAIVEEPALLSVCRRASDLLAEIAHKSGEGVAARWDIGGRDEFGKDLLRLHLSDPEGAALSEIPPDTFAPPFEPSLRLRLAWMRFLEARDARFLLEHMGAEVA